MSKRHPVAKPWKPLKDHTTQVTKPDMRILLHDAQVDLVEASRLIKRAFDTVKLVHKAMNHD